MSIPMPRFIKEISCNILMRSGKGKGITIVAHFDKSWAGGRNKKRYATRLGKNLMKLLDSEKVIVTDKGNRLEINAHEKAVGTVTSALSRLSGIEAYEVAYGSRRGRMVKGLGGLPSGTTLKGPSKGIGIMEGTGVLSYQGVRFRQPPRTTVQPAQMERPAQPFEGRPEIKPRKFSGVAIVHDMDELKALDIKHTTASLIKEDGKVHFYERHKNYNPNTQEATNGGWVHIGVSNPNWEERITDKYGRYSPDQGRRYIDGAYVSRDVHLSPDSVVDGTSKVLSLSDPRARGLFEEAMSRNHTPDKRWLERRWREISEGLTSDKGEALIEHSEILDNSMVIGAFVNGYKLSGEAIVAGNLMFDENLHGSFDSREIKQDIFPGSSGFATYSEERDRYIRSIPPSQNRIDKKAYLENVRKAREDEERKAEAEAQKETE